MKRTSGVLEAVRKYNGAYDTIGANIYCDCEAGVVFAKEESGWTDFGPSVVNLCVKGRAKPVWVRERAIVERQNYLRMKEAFHA